ncbi:uncharacterized protein JCM6883_000488 [Sporobolomyces salmoneus]|uniref:uncharacterized protein n=1 Tax=Sporobolomyces salmoneus TaxID=183962 RepID=UPI00316F5C19
MHHSFPNDFDKIPRDETYKLVKSWVLEATSEMRKRLKELELHNGPRTIREPLEERFRAFSYFALYFLGHHKGAELTQDEDDPARKPVQHSRNPHQPVARNAGWSFPKIWGTREEGSIRLE